MSEDKAKRGSVFRWRSRRSATGDTSRRQVLAIGAVGVFAAAGIVAGITPAWAVTYPSWDDVEKARGNEAAAAAQVASIQQLIANLEAQVATTQAEAEKKGEEYFAAQQAFDDAAVRADSLQAQADTKKVEADESIAKAGQVAAQLYRSGGSDVSLSLFFDASASPDALLGALGTMSKLLEHNKSVYDQAVNARNTAQSLSDQAQSARDERERLRGLAEDAMVAAQAAADAAASALAEQQDKKIELQAQLAALRDTTSKTIQGYKEGVEEERKRAEAAAAAAAAAESTPPPAQMANGGIVSLIKENMKTTGDGIESFLMKYKEPIKDAVSPERRAAALKRTLRQLQPPPTAPGPMPIGPGPMPTMQQGIMPMAG